MTRTLLLSLLLGLVSSTGCMVMDEIDSANAKMNKGSKATGAATDPASDAAAAAIKTKNQLLEESKEWWGRATSLAPAAVDSSIVSCRLREGTQFMAKDDCLTQGGVPKGISG